MHTTQTLTPEELAAELAEISGDATKAIDELHCYNCGAELLEPNFNRCCAYCSYHLNAEAEYDRRREEG